MNIAQLVREKKLCEGSIIAYISPYISKEKILKTGFVTSTAIICLCTLCEGQAEDEKLGLTAFEKHSESGHKRPTRHIFVHDNAYGGYKISLESMKNDPKKDSRPHSYTGGTLRGNEQTSRSRTSQGALDYHLCDLCYERGRTEELVFCSSKSCHAVFHPSCSTMELLLDGRWFCPKCICWECRSPVCERTPRSSIFQTYLANGDQWNPLRNCEQCGDVYHSECLTERTREKTSDSKSFRRFCSTNCEQMAEIIENSIKLSLQPGDVLPLTWVKWDEELFLSLLDNPGYDFPFERRKSFGKLQARCSEKLHYAMKVLEKSFQAQNGTPGRTEDLFQKLLYNHKSVERDLDHNGFSVALIEEDMEQQVTKTKRAVIRQVIAAATIRIHSQKVAEMPFIATLESHRGKHICSRLLNAIEEKLRQLGVHKWVVQSPARFEDMWTRKFSFHPIGNIAAKSLFKESNLLKVENTALVYKNL